MENFFQSNLKKLSERYSQRFLAEKTGFSQSSINNYLTKTNEPSMQFLIALNKAFGFSVDDFLFRDCEQLIDGKFDNFIGNYMVYYYNNNAYKGEVHNNLKNTLKYGVISIFKDREFKLCVMGSFFKNKEDATAMLSVLNATKSGQEILREYQKIENPYSGIFHTSSKNLFIYLTNEQIEDECFIIMNNPPISSPTTKYLGGLGTINTVARGREHNPCVQYVIITRKVIDRPDGEIYNHLQLDYANISFDTQVNDLVALFKRLYIENNDLSNVLNEEQKLAVIENNVKFHFNGLVEANMFRFGKISNREDDALFKILREGIDV